MKIKLLLITISLCIVACLIISFGREIICTKIHSKQSESITTNVDSSNENTTLISPLTNKDFIIKDKNNYIELGGKYEDLKTNEKITEYEPSDATTFYDYYLFESFGVITDTGGKDDCKIFKIKITESTIQTSRKIKVGDSASMVLEAYGKTEYNKYPSAAGFDGYYKYQYEDKIIKFFMDENAKVSEIDLEIL